MQGNDLNFLPHDIGEDIDYGEFVPGYIESQLDKPTDIKVSSSDKDSVVSDNKLLFTRKLVNILNETRNINQFVDVATLFDMGVIDFDILENLLRTQSRLEKILGFKSRLVDLYYSGDEKGKLSFRENNNLKPPVGELLLEKGLIDKALLTKALKIQSKNKKRLLGQIILDLTDNNSLIILELLKLNSLNIYNLTFGELRLESIVEK
ncbi:MAG: hypothetical protein PHS49_06245 [Candidatus Gracilibacteria bacterium]|nr:hypothetical protein [Candidatus Gracilibacteria bacterium]